MVETPSLVNISTKLQRVAKLAHDARELAFTTHAHHLDLAWMREAFRRTRKDGASGVDDKVLQRAVAMLLGAIYEEDFAPFSYGFRPGRSAHQALEALRDGIMGMGGGWIVEVDIRKFFDTVDHERVQEVVRHRVHDGVLLRLIGK